MIDIRYQIDLPEFFLQPTEDFFSLPAVSPFPEITNAFDTMPEMFLFPPGFAGVLPAHYPMFP